MRRLSLATSQVSFSPQDVVFAVGTRSTVAYFIIEGGIENLQEPKTFRVEEAVRQIVEPNSWVCEAALWSEWLTIGKSETLSQTRAVDGLGLWMVRL